jgi:uncharacterized glyoxalase superfamily protein PhnB
MSNIKRAHSNLYFVKDLEQTLEFYKNLGFAAAITDDAARIKLGDFNLVFMDESRVHIDKEVGMEPKGLGVFTYVETDDVDEHYKLVVENGAKPSSQPTSFPWGKREFAVKDPDGFKIIFYQNI